MLLVLLLVLLVHRLRADPAQPGALTDWLDSVVLAALVFTRHGAEGRRLVDVSENALYWRFVWLAWLPIYCLIYWLPRWVR
jgi:hypothetical protein